MFQLIRGLILVIFLLVAMTLLVSCGTHDVSQELDKNTYYRRDLRINAGPTENLGYVVPPVMQQYALKIYSPVNADHVLITSCHRSVSIEKQKGKKHNGQLIFEYLLIPSEVEKTRTCPIEIIVSQQNNNHSFGAVYLRPDKYELSARVFCNGHLPYWSKGIGVCESLHSTVQRFEFLRPVAVASDCPFDISKTGLVLEVELQKGYCAYAVMEKNSGKKMSIIGYGFEEYILRKQD